MSAQYVSAGAGPPESVSPGAVEGTATEAKVLPRSARSSSLADRSPGGLSEERGTRKAEILGLTIDLGQQIFWQYYIDPDARSAQRRDGNQSRNSVAVFRIGHDGFERRRLG